MACSPSEAAGLTWRLRPRRWHFPSTLPSPSRRKGATVPLNFFSPPRARGCCCQPQDRPRGNGVERARQASAPFSSRAGPAGSTVRPALQHCCCLAHPCPCCLAHPCSRCRPPLSTQALTEGKLGEGVTSFALLNTKNGPVYSKNNSLPVGAVEAARLRACKTSLTAQAHAPLSLALSLASPRCGWRAWPSRRLSLC